MQTCPKCHRKKNARQRCSCMDRHIERPMEYHHGAPHQGHPQAIPVTFAPGFDDIEIITDHQGNEHIYVGQNTAIGDAVSEALTTQAVVDLLCNLTADQIEKLRPIFAGIVMSGDDFNSLFIGGDGGIMSNNCLSAD